jgi:hypothetical protein
VAALYTMLLQVDLRGAAGAVGHLVYVLVHDVPVWLVTGAMHAMRKDLALKED